MISRNALPMLALLLGGCAAKDRPVQPVPVLAEQRLCPAYPLPPKALHQAPRQDGLPQPERLIATEQAIQLDELIKWVERQHAVDPAAACPTSQLRKRMRAVARSEWLLACPSLRLSPASPALMRLYW